LSVAAMQANRVTAATGRGGGGHQVTNADAVDGGEGFEK